MRLVEGDRYVARTISHHWFRRTARAAAHRRNEVAQRAQSVATTGRWYVVEPAKRGPYKWAVVEHDYSETHG